MRVTIKPSANPTQEIDITGALVGAVAAEIWKHCGGNDVLNWMEAEQFVASLVARRAVPPESLATEIERKTRSHPRPSRPRDDGGQPTKRRAETDPERVTGPLPLY